MGRRVGLRFLGNVMALLLQGWDSTTIKAGKNMTGWLVELTDESPA